MPSITTITKNYLQAHPSIHESLRKGLINYSALARHIAKEKGIQKIDAILVAARRYKETLQKRNDPFDFRKHVKVEIKTSRAIITVKSADVKKLLKLEEPIQIVKTSSTTKIIMGEDSLEKISSLFSDHIVSKKENLAEITLKKVNDDILPFIYSVSNSANIPLLETFSSEKELIVVIKEDDLSKFMSLLRF